MGFVDSEAHDMATKFELVNDRKELGAVIKIVGVGSGGVNAVNTMMAAKVTGVDYIAMNTDVQSLQLSSADIKLELAGPTKGRGAGGDPAKGREAAVQEKQRIEEFLKGADMCVIATGLGGGTGTGATPVVGEIARNMGILTVAVVTLPFNWEGPTKARRAIEGLDVLKQSVDAYVVIPNDKMKKVTPKGLPTFKAFQLIDQVLCDSVTGVVELITRPGYINRDFEDVRAVLEACGLCVMGVGVGEGEERAMDAVSKALYNPLLEDTPIEGARHILVNVVQGPDGTPDENELIMQKINECMAADGNVSFGLAFDEKLGERVKVTIIASGMEDIESIDARATEAPATQRYNQNPRGVQFAPAAPAPSARPAIPTWENDPFEQRAAARPPRAPAPWQLNVSQPQNAAPSIFAGNPAGPAYPDGESELDPTPAFLRLGNTGYGKVDGR